jgi:hypothetical protein
MLTGSIPGGTLPDLVFADNESISTLEIHRGIPVEAFPLGTIESERYL